MERRSLEPPGVVRAPEETGDGLSVTGASPDVGSSNKLIGWQPTRARAISKRRRLPLERESNRRFFPPDQTGAPVPVTYPCVISHNLWGFFGNPQALTTPCRKKYAIPAGTKFAPSFSCKSELRLAEDGMTEGLKNEQTEKTGVH